MNEWAKLHSKVVCYSYAVKSGPWQTRFSQRRIFRDTIDPMFPANDGVDDTERYLLLCQSYEEPRRELLNCLNAILPPSDFSNLSNELLVELILLCNERLRPDVNKGLIEDTLKFIQATKRF